MRREFPLTPMGKMTWVTAVTLALVVPLLIIVAVVLNAPASVQAGVIPMRVAMLGICVAMGCALLVTLRRLRVSIEGDRLVVRAAFYTRRVRLAELDTNAARIVDLDHAPEWKPRLRMNGISLPGARIGHFRGLPWHRKMFCALTSHQRVLVLPERSDERFLLLSLERPQALQEALKGAAR